MGMLILLSVACGKKETPAEEQKVESEEQDTSSEVPESSEPQEPESSEESSEESQEVPEEESSSEPEEEQEMRENIDIEESQMEESMETEIIPLPGTGKLIVIDPGHQAHGNAEQEPVGPGASETKKKVSSGTRSTTTGLYEYELVLEVSLQLRDELEARGYTVIMTRESHDVNISNIERAQIANEAGADAFLRIHANGSESAATNGAMTLCNTSTNPYNADIYPQCYSLASHILDGILEQTGANSQGIWQTDTMSGINWSQVPVTIVEMGYMTNPEEDAKLASPEYQALMVQGIANGLDAFFADQE